MAFDYKFVAMLSHVSYRVTEEPYKIPYYTALLRALDENVEDNTDDVRCKERNVGYSVWQSDVSEFVS